MRRYLRSSAVNDPVSAWGLYKSDDDQTHSDDLRCRGGWRGGNLARASAQGYPAPPGCRSIRGAAALSARRLSADYRRAPALRISMRWTMTRRRMRRVRPRCRRPVRCFRRMIRAMAARWGPPVYSDRAAPTGPVLSPDDPRYGRPMALAGLFRPRAPTGPVLSPDDPRYGRPMGAAGLFRPRRADRPDPVAG